MPDYLLFLFLGVQKKELSVIGEACELGDKVTVKQCSIGKGCQIGAKSKLNNCVIMDYTIIGERYETR
jgi:carbonic anhydrase/acetyltransferase-like protein (isoleucine patch superfamily)